MSVGIYKKKKKRDLNEYDIDINGLNRDGYNINSVDKNGLNINGIEGTREKYPQKNLLERL